MALQRAIWVDPARTHGFPSDVTSEMLYDGVGQGGTWRLHMKMTLSVVLALGAGAASAGAQGVVGIYIADPDNGRILRYTMSGGPHTIEFASGAPLVKPVAMGWVSSPNGGLVVCDEGAGGLFVVNHITGGFVRTLVEPGAGGLVSPVAFFEDSGGVLFVLDGHDGAVRRYSATTGAFIDQRIAPRGPAVGMVWYSLPAPPPQPRMNHILIAYRDTGELARFDADTGQFLGTLAVSPGATWFFASEDRVQLVAESRQDPFVPDRVYQLRDGLLNFLAELPLGQYVRGLGIPLHVSTGDGVIAFKINSPFPDTFYPASPGHQTGAIFSSWCYPNCDGSIVLDIFDFLCFGERFALGDPYSCECDTTTGPGTCDILDFLCFANWFNWGC